MAILANTNGTVISVIATDKPNVWKENCNKGSLFTLKPSQTHRKVFDGVSAVEDALAWIALERPKAGGQ